MTKNTLEIENKELKIKGFKEIQESTGIILNNLNSIRNNKKNTSFDLNTACKVSLANLVFLIKTLDQNSDKQTVKDLDYLYKHVMFCILRVRDHADYAYIDNAVTIVEEINEGWDRVTSALKNFSAA